MSSISVKKTIILALLSILVFLPGIASLPVTDRDEARFAQASKQMMETGDYTQIYFQETTRSKKPVGIYWIQVASNKLFSSPPYDKIVYYRIPSFLSAFFSVLALYFYASKFLGEQKGFLSALILMSCFVVLAEARLAKTDAALLLASIVTMGTIGRAYTERALSWTAFFLGWVFLGAGLLIKGPVIAVLVALTVTTLLIIDKDRSWILVTRPLLGVVILALIVLPWFIEIQEKTSGDFLNKAIKGDILPKLSRAHESHGGFPLFYIITSLLAFWPWSFFIPSSIFEAFKDRKNTDKGLKFIFYWLVPTWCFFELMPTKLPHYTLPVYPALSMVLANYSYDFLCNSGQLKDQYESLVARYFAKAWIVCWCLTTVILIILGSAILYVDILHWFSHRLLYISIVSLLIVIFGIYLINSQRRYQGFFTFSFVSVLFLALLLPNLKKIWLTDAIMEKLRTLSPYSDVAFSGYPEPSIVFEYGTNTKFMESGAALGKWLQSTCDRLGVVTAKQEPSFLSSFVENPPKKVDTIQGINYSNGKFMQIYFYRANCSN